jgi:hypothetical protein
MARTQGLVLCLCLCINDFVPNILLALGRSPMNTQFKLSACAAWVTVLLTSSGCHTVEAPKYSDLVKAWHPISIYHVADGTHIIVVQSITNGVESGKYIWPMFSSIGPGGSGFVLSGWRDQTGSSLIDLGGREGLATVLEYTRGQPDGAANRSQPVPSGTNLTSAPAGSGR